MRIGEGHPEFVRWETGKRLLTGHERAKREAERAEREAQTRQREFEGGRRAAAEEAWLRAELARLPSLAE